MAVVEVHSAKDIDPIHVLRQHSLGWCKESAAYMRATPTISAHVPETMTTPQAVGSAVAP